MRRGNNKSCGERNSRRRGSGKSLKLWRRRELKNEAGKNKIVKEGITKLKRRTENNKIVERRKIEK